MTGINISLVVRKFSLIGRIKNTEHDYDNMVINNIKLYYTLLYT